MRNERIPPVDESLPGRWYQVVCDGDDFMPLGMYLRADEEAHLLIGHHPVTGDIIHLDLWQIGVNACLEPLDDGEVPMTEEQLVEAIDPGTERVDPPALANRGELLYSVVSRQVDLEDQLSPPAHAHGFDDEESGLFITPVYVRAHDRLLAAVAQDLIDHGAEGRRLAGEIFAAHQRVLPGSGSRRDAAGPGSDVDREA